MGIFFSAIVGGTVLWAIWEARAEPVAQPAPAAATQPSQSSSQSAAATQETPVFRPRLPAYYARVVDEQQRKKIYEIQRKYHAQIADLQRQLEKLVAQRDAEIEAVLSPQQKAEIEKLRQEAAARRAQSKEGTTSSEQSEPKQP